MSQKLKAKLFIDANIYLAFYDKDAVKLQELLEPLVEVKESIIATDQIVDEVIRNRYRIVREYFDLCHSQTLVPIKETSLPKHITTSLKTKLDQWNDFRNDLVAIAKKQNRLFSEIQKKSLQMVYNGSDEVSETLDKIFSQSISPTSEEIANATLRKALGNPPGKKQKMGDELNWEQVLNQLDGIDTLIIVSDDTDYRLEKKDDRLHPLLVAEVKKRHPKLEVRLYKSLSPAIDYFNTLQPKSEKLTLPKKATMKKIEQEEQIISGSTISQMINSGVTITDLIENRNPSISRGMQLLIDTINSDFCEVCKKYTPTSILVSPFGDTPGIKQCTQCHNISSK